MRSAAVIPVLNEADAIATTIREIPRDLCTFVVVVDGGSADGTAEAARRAGAEVVPEPRRGYGRAVAAGIARAEQRGAEVLVILDGNGTVDAAAVRHVLAPVLAGDADLAIGARAAGAANLRPVQRLGNRIATRLIARLFGVRYHDIGPIRAVRADALRRLRLGEPGYGWPLALHVEAAAEGLRVVEIPFEPRPRLGRSKVSGTLRGTLGASVAFLRILAMSGLRSALRRQRTGLPTEVGS